MKLVDISIGKEYAIVPSWTYSNQSARNIDTVRENDVVKATIVSLDKYEYEPSNRKSDPSGFTKAQAGNRSVGVLVSAIDSNGNTIYWTSRLADIVAEWSALEPKWNAKKSKEEEEQRKREEEQRKERELHRVVDEEVERSRASVSSSAKDLLGRGDVTVRASGYGLDYKAEVTITLAEFEKLMELAYEGKAVLA